mgnify:CR=1 FL=1
MKLMINTGAVGYKGQSKTVVDVDFVIAEEPSDFLVELLGDTKPVLKYSRFEVENIDALAASFIAEGCTKEKALEYTEKHLKKIIKDHVLFNDKLLVKEIQ